LPHVGRQVVANGDTAGSASPKWHWTSNTIYGYSHIYLQYVYIQVICTVKWSVFTNRLHSTFKRKIQCQTGYSRGRRALQISLSRRRTRRASRHLIVALSTGVSTAKTSTTGSHVTDIKLRATLIVYKNISKYSDNETIKWIGKYIYSETVIYTKCRRLAETAELVCTRQSRRRS
jgi:hypothetical protein